MHVDLGSSHLEKKVEEMRTSCKLGKREEKYSVICLLLGAEKKD